MHEDSRIEKIEKDLEHLPEQEQLEFLERVIAKLKKKLLISSKGSWRELYGIGKGLWEVDAQEYVNALREDR